MLGTYFAKSLELLQTAIFADKLQDLSKGRRVCRQGAEFADKNFFQGGCDAPTPPHPDGPAPDIANISILRTEIYFPSFYSNKSLINHFYITILRYNELSVLRTKFSFPPTKTPRYNELKALNATESKSTRWNVKVQIDCKAILDAVNVS